MLCVVALLLNMSHRKMRTLDTAESRVLIVALKCVLFLFLLDSANSEVYLALYRKSLKSKEMDHDGTHFDGNYPHIFVVLGASVSYKKF